MSNVVKKYIAYRADKCLIDAFGGIASCKFNFEYNFLEVLPISQNIPSRGREAIYNVTKCLIDTNAIYCNNGKIQSISKTTCKDVYWNFVTKRRLCQNVVKNGQKTIQISRRQRTSGQIYLN